MSTNGKTGWAEGLAASRAWVLVKGTSVVGRALKLHAPGEYTSPVNDQPVDAPVLELLGGHAFVAQEGDAANFVEIDERAANYHGDVAPFLFLLAEPMTIARASTLKKASSHRLLSAWLRSRRPDGHTFAKAPLEQA